ncbi:hypothetical protein L596_005939 [Steinernema carpocapsae]|uniref:Uncharacterized protein n=1 Tax=Steinernema carpocapsae TaxID=34508 RepID=A0A4U8V0V5_STECR|nr:hypothetical protein L596_005939 [Steinernema carpocapsae]
MQKGQLFQVDQKQRCQFHLTSSQMQSIPYNGGSPVTIDRKICKLRCFSCCQKLIICRLIAKNGGGRMARKCVIFSIAAP